MVLREGGDLVVAVGWYLSFATALLPLVVLAERGGLRRAWWLAHSRLSTALQVCAVLAVGWAVDTAVDLGLEAAPLVRIGAGDGFLAGREVELIVEVVAGAVVGVFTGVLATVALAAAYARRMPAPDPDPADPAPAEPVVIELARTR